MLRIGIVGSVELTKLVPVACALLHNFVQSRRGHDDRMTAVARRAKREELLQQEKMQLRTVDLDDDDDDVDVDDATSSLGRDAEDQGMVNRDVLAARMWTLYQRHLSHRSTAPLMHDADLRAAHSMSGCLPRTVCFL